MGNRRTAQESVEYIAEQVVGYVKENINQWIDSGMDDVDIDDEVVSAIERFGAPLDKDMFGEVMEYVVSDLEDAGILTESRYVYQAGRESGRKAMRKKADWREEAVDDIVFDAISEIRNDIDQWHEWEYDDDDIRDEIMEAISMSAYNLGIDLDTDIENDCYERIMDEMGDEVYAKRASANSRNSPYGKKAARMRRR